MKSSPGIMPRNARKSPSMLGSFTTIGRRKTTSSVLVLARLRELNNEPINGMALMMGIVSSTSLTNLTRRVVVGLTFNRIVSLSLICGVTFMTNPTGTVIGVVFVAVVVPTFAVATTLTCTLK